MGTPQGAFAVGGVHGKPSAGDVAKTWASVLAELPLFAGVPKRHLRRIASLGQEARFARGSQIVRAGEPGNGFFLILQGAASIVRPSGLPSIPIGVGSYFGEMALIDGGRTFGHGRGRHRRALPEALPGAVPAHAEGRA